MIARAAARLRRDPLAHFLAIGLAVFALDRATGEDANDPTLMRIDGAVYGELVDIYAAANGREPTEEEMRPLVSRWILNETLYREALARGLDQGDEMIRERIAQKMRILIRGGVDVDAPDDDTLRAFFEARRADYVDPATLSIEIARIGRGEAEARRWAQRLNALDERDETPPADAPRVFAFYDRPRDAMVSVFGAPFLDAVEALPPTIWTAMDTPDGWHAARLIASAPRYEASFEEARNAVLADWRQQAQRQAEYAAVEALVDRYDVLRGRYDPAAYRARAAAAARDAGPDDTQRVQ